MNTKHFIYFITVAQTRSIRKAAHYLQISPSTISSGLKELSDVWNVELYSKTVYGIELTEAGYLLYDAAQKLLAILNECHHQFQNSQHTFSGDFQFAALPGIMSYILAPVNQNLFATASRFKLTFHILDKENILLQLNKNQIDLGFINLSEDDIITMEKLYPDLIFQKQIEYSFVFLANKTHPLANKIIINEKELLHSKIVIYLHNELTDNPFFLAINNVHQQIRFSKSSNYNSHLINEYNYLTPVPYFNKKLQEDFFDIHSHVLLFPKKEINYYVVSVQNKNTVNQTQIDNYLSFVKQFYPS